MYGQVWQTAQTAPKELAGRLEVLGRGLEARLRVEAELRVGLQVGLQAGLHVEAGLWGELQAQVGLQAGLHVEAGLRVGPQVGAGLRAGLQVQVQAGVRVRSLVQVV